MFVQPSTSRFPPQPLNSLAALATVRVAFVEWMQDCGIENERVEDLSVVISELGANAVRETPEGAEPPSVAADLDAKRLVLEVANAVSEQTVPPHEHEWNLDDPLRTGGRGLLLVSAFVDEVDVDVVDGRLVVRCVATV